jgi:hypothetical protein
VSALWVDAASGAALSAPGIAMTARCSTGAAHPPAAPSVAPLTPRSSTALDVRAVMPENAGGALELSAEFLLALAPPSAGGGGGGGGGGGASPSTPLLARILSNVSTALPPSLHPARALTLSALPAGWTVCAAARANNSAGWSAPSGVLPPLPLPAGWVGGAAASAPCLTLGAATAPSAPAAAPRALTSGLVDATALGAAAAARADLLASGATARAASLGGWAEVVAALNDAALLTSGGGGGGGPADGLEAVGALASGAAAAPRRSDLAAAASLALLRVPLPADDGGAPLTRLGLEMSSDTFTWAPLPASAALPLWSAPPLEGGTALLLPLPPSFALLEVGAPVDGSTAGANASSPLIPLSAAARAAAGARGAAPEALVLALPGGAAAVRAALGAPADASLPALYFRARWESAAGTGSPSARSDALPAAAGGGVAPLPPARPGTPSLAGALAGSRATLAVPLPLHAGSDAASLGDLRIRV